MKHQYFGDINDFRKYGLLRQLSNFGQITSSVCWMLTPDTAGNADGQKLAYLEQPHKYRHHDPALFDLLHEKVQRRGMRNVDTAYMPKILPHSWLFDELVPDDKAGRKLWFDRYLHKAYSSELVFFDPDNGLEVPSVPFGAKDAPKYLYWQEVQQAYAAGHSLLIYQHFPRVARNLFIPSLAARFREVTGSRDIQAFSTSHVVFFLVRQHSFPRFNLPECWKGQLSETLIALDQPCKSDIE